jgi:hypothetical protein
MEKYEEQKKDARFEIEIEADTKLNPLKEDLKSKNGELQTELHAAFKKYEKKRVVVWNQELIRMHNTVIKPIAE